MLKTKDGVSLRFARLRRRPAARARSACSRAAPNSSRNISRPCATCARAASRSPPSTGAGRALSERVLGDPLKGHVRDFAEYENDVEAFMREIVLPDCPPPHFAIGAFDGRERAAADAHQGRRWFDRMVMSAPMIGLSTQDLSALRAAGDEDHAAVRHGSSYVPGGDATVMAAQPFIGNPVTSDPVRHARTVAMLEARALARSRRADRRLGGGGLRRHGPIRRAALPAQIRQPMVLVAAGRDEIVSTSATEEFGLRLRAGAHLIVNGAKHELLMEQDRYRSQFWAAFDAFVPGTPLFD